MTGWRLHLLTCRNLPIPLAVLPLAGTTGRNWPKDWKFCVISNYCCLNQPSQLLYFLLRWMFHSLIPVVIHSSVPQMLSRSFSGPPVVNKICFCLHGSYTELLNILVNISVWGNFKKSTENWLKMYFGIKCFAVLITSFQKLMGKMYYVTILHGLKKYSYLWISISTNFLVSLCSVRCTFN